MSRSRIGSVAVALAAVAAGAAHAQQQPASDGPTVTVYRTFQGPEFTVVQGLVRIDPVELGSASCTYGINVVVRDAAGGALVNNSWENSCPVVAGEHRAALETFQFALRPARYSLEVSVYPKDQPAERQTTRRELEAFATPPAASDLVLASAVGLADSAGASGWTVRRGGIGLRAASEMVIDPAAPNLAYYLELYPDSGEVLNGTAEAVVRRADGKALHTFPLPAITGAKEPQPMAATLSVAGLPAGSYTFDVLVQLADTTIVRSHPFRVLEAVAAAGTPAGYFANLSDADVAAKFDAVVVWLENKTDAERYQTLSPVGKREYLRQLFGGQGPDPDDGVDSPVEVYLERAEYVEAHFAERAGRGRQPGWQTDRGRIWLLHGAPGSHVDRPSPRSGSPYDIWYYTHQNRYVYLFADETRMGNYRLIYTNDPAQEGVANWDRRVGIQAIEDMQQMGIQLPVVGGSTGN